eukprot:scaffold473_cov132-Cylindrotheca_fusiformis.AAC.18
MVPSTKASSCCKAKVDSAEKCTNKKMSRKHTSTHSTIINAPTRVVWETLSDINAWEWNQCVHLVAACALEGQCGKTRITKNGRRFYHKSFSFKQVKQEEYIFSWSTKFGFCTCTNTMKLNPVGGKRTHLLHTQSFVGPYLGLVHPFKKLRKQVCLMNEGLKIHVESLYFNSLLSNFSSREIGSICSKSVSTDNTESSDLSSAGNFWETPKHVRVMLMKCFVDDELQPVYSA